MYVKNFLINHTPPFLKILLRQFGIRSITISALKPLLFMSISGALIVGLNDYVPVEISISIILLLVFILITTKQTDIVGKALLSFGMASENMSNEHRAKTFYLMASRLLDNKNIAYDRWSNIANDKEGCHRLIRLIKRNNRDISRETALLLAKNYLNLGDLHNAIKYSETAENILDDTDIQLKLADLYLKIGNPEKCLEKLEAIECAESQSDFYFYQKAKVNRMLNRAEKAIEDIDKAIIIRPFNADYHYEKGLSLERLGLIHEAIKKYDKSIYLHEKNPDALYRKGLLYLQLSMFRAALKNLRQCIYYDNNNSHAFMLVQWVKENEKKAKSFHKKRTQNINIHADKQYFNATKGQLIKLKLKIISNVSIKKCLITAVEPFGGGLEVLARRIIFLDEIDKDKTYHVSFDVIMKRSSMVNCNKPWILNIVCSNDAFWTDKHILFDVRDEADGKIYFVLTEDHEMGARINESRLNGNREITIDQARLDLIDKSLIANKIAEDYGIKWTHMVDGGSALGLPRFASTRGSQWDKFYGDLKDYYITAYQKGHDCQLHIHLVALPESYFFCYRHEKITDHLEFDLSKKEKHFPLKQINSWANVVNKFGTENDPDSRLGSLFFIKNELESILCKEYPDFRALLFRAGQWDLGKNIAEIEKSALSLKKAGILADSTATKGGTYYDRDFGFGKPPHLTAYFCCKNNLLAEARSLQDFGILEILPVKMPQGNHPITPRSNPKYVINAYKSFFEDKKIKPGRHIIMEMEHIVTINSEKQDKKDLNRHHGSWRYIKNHFKKVTQGCKKMEFVTASEAIYSYLDYYSPAVLVRLKSPAFYEGNSNNVTKVLFEIQFLGEGIITKTKRFYAVSIPIPRLKNVAIQRAKIMENDEVKFTARKIKDRLSVNLLLSNHNKHNFRLELCWHYHKV